MILSRLFHSLAAACCIFGSAATLARAEDAPPALVLKPDSFQHYVEQFNKNDEELYVNYVPNEKAWDFLKANIPLLECPNKDIEEIYYFRWWTFRKHLKETPDGFVVTEFLPKVSWSGKHNTISCPAGHHLYEGRWLRDQKFLNDYSLFWFRKGGEPRRYSFWAADAIWARYLTNHDANLPKELLPDLIRNYEAWEKSRLDPTTGLFWQIDDRDGMEVSIGGSGLRATINSYMYGDAIAIANIADLTAQKDAAQKDAAQKDAAQKDIAKTYRDKATAIKKLVQEKLWDPDAKFFKVLGRSADKQGKVTIAEKLADVREEHGYTPWYFNLPDRDKGYEEAWKQLMDPQGFFAEYGPTSAEQRHPGFKISYKGHGCQWNGPSWPYATSVTLTALANVLNNYKQTAISKADYLKTLEIYTKSHHLKRDDGKVLPWIDENIDPLTGVWIDRLRSQEWNKDPNLQQHGKDYNHSSYTDLIITGLVGLRPAADNKVTVNPLLPENTWDYFCLDNVPYHGHDLTILWDKSGEKYGKGKGLKLFIDGKEAAHAETLTKITGTLPAP